MSCNRDIEAEAAVMRQAMERAVHLIGCGHDEEARRLLLAHLSGTSAGRELLRASERDRERAARCLRDHVGPALAASLRSGVRGD
jgi:signal transduction histidine kinase